jgi:head-tail adaptor
MIRVVPRTVVASVRLKMAIMICDIVGSDANGIAGRAMAIRSTIETTIG